MSADDSKKEYIRALEQRDQRIDQLKTELENVTRLKNQELANLTQKMEFIMDEKDHQIKVSNGNQLKNPDIAGAIFTLSLSIRILNSQCVEGARDVRVL